MQCLNIKNKEVAALLDEYTNVLGSYDAAYYVLSENNGYGLDKAPNGEPSKLFSDLLEHYKGDRVAAIQAKAKTYSESFRNWFGESKVVDENGEPLVVYHHANSPINEFSIEFDNYFSTVKGGTKKALFFTGTANPKKGTVLDREYKHPVFLKADRVIEKFGTKDELKKQGEDFTTTINRASEEADIAIFHGIDDNQELNQNIYVVNNPNNVKSIDNQGTFSTQDNNIYRNESEINVDADIESTETTISSISAYDYLNSIINLYNQQGVDSDLLSPSQVELVNAILTRDLSNVTIRISNAINRRETYTHGIKQKRTTLGDYRYVDGKHVITMYTSATGGDVHKYTKTLLHELVHAFTVDVYDNPKTDKEQRFVKFINDAYSKYSTVANETTLRMYGFTNPKEFLAEILTNGEFARSLQDLDYKIIELDKQNEYVEKEISKNKSFLSRILDKILNLLGLFKSKQTVTYVNVKRELLDIITNHDLKQSNDSMVYESLSDTTVIPNKVISSHADILQVIKNKINTITHSKNQDPRKTEELNQLLTQLGKAESDQAVLSFVKYLFDDVQQSFNILKNYISQYKEYEKGLVGVNPVTSDKLDLIRKGTIGFYNGLVTSLQNMLEDPEVIRYLHSLGEYDRTFNTLREASNQYHELVRYFNLLSDKIAKKNIVEEAAKRGSFSIDNLKRILDEGDTDLSWWDRYVGQTQYNNKEVIRLLLDKMVEGKYRVYDKKMEVGKRLLTLLSKVNKSDLKLLYERGKDGKRTGNFISDLNYGQHANDYMEHMTKFVERLGVTVPPHVEFYDIPSILNQEQLKQWNKEKNNWDATHSERRFTKDYYDLMNNLSEAARSRKESIDMDIKMLLATTADSEGNYHREDLSEEDYNRLLSLESAKRNLSNSFYYDGTPKTGEDRDVALELQKYNKTLRDKLNYTVNEEAFKKARAKAKKTLSPEKFVTWEKRNTLDKISEQFYEDLKLLSANKVKSADQLSYEAARSQLLRLYTVDNKIDILNMPAKVKELIVAFDQLIAMENFANKSGNGKKSRIMEIAEWQIDPRFYDELNMNRTPEEKEKWFKANASYDSRGNIVPASFWKKLVPKKELRAKYFEKVPNSSWLEVDKNSPFYNKNFDESKGVARIPKRSLYDNSTNYNKVKGDLKVLLDALKATMQESVGYLPFLTSKNNLTLPQIEGGTMTQILSRDNVLKGLGYSFKDVFTVKDDDEQYNVDKALNPDGTRVRLIPTRYLKKLDNPEALTNDIVGSVIAFYGMAANYSEMSKIAPDVEMITDFLSRQTYKDRNGGIIPALSSRTYAKAVEMMEQFVYGMSEDAMMTDIKVGDKKVTISIAKALSKLAAFTRLNGMANNLHVILTGAFTNKAQVKLDAMSGLYYDNTALRKASLEITKSYRHAIANIGNPNNKNKALVALEWSGTVRSTETAFTKLNQSRWLRALNQHFWYGGYEIADYITKGKMAIAVMMNYKFDPSTGKFINKANFLNKFDNEKIGNAEWNRLTTTFYDAVEVKNNQFAIKPEYAKYVDEITANRIRNTIKQVGTRIDTQFTDLDKSFVNANAFCKLLFIYKNFLLINLQTKFITKRNYDYSTGMWQEAQFRGAFNYIYRHYFNKEKIGILKEMYRNYDELDRFEKRLLKRASMEFVFAYIFMYLFSSFFMGLAGDDDDSWWKNELALIGVRTGIESRSNLIPYETITLFNSPTAAWGIIENFWKALSTMFDEPTKEIERGPYKGMRRWQRSLIKITPFRAIYEAKDPKSKMQYYNR